MTALNVASFVVHVAL